MLTILYSDTYIDIIYRYRYNAEKNWFDYIKLL